MIRNARFPWLLALLMTLTAPVPAADESVKLSGLSADVTVWFDDHAIPHIYAATRTDAARALGYLHAANRLWQMDMFRRQASGNTAEVVGKSGLESDILMRRLGIRRGCEALWKSDEIPQELRAELEAYSEGVNARLRSLGPDELPVYFKVLGYQPAKWTPVDSLVFNKYMGWDQSGTNDDLWFGAMVEKLGIAAVEELWPLDRPYELPTVTTQANRRALSKPMTKPVAHAASACQAAFASLSRVKSPLRGLSFGSNNWAVDGTKTASGRAILANDPHLGFHLPSVWYTAHVCVAGKNVAGAMFPGSPGFVIGHNDHIAWGVTNMQTDAVDYYVETLHPDDSGQYQHRGQWHKLKRVTERISVRGESDHVLEIDYTIHGPIVSNTDRAISLCWTGLGPTTEVVSFWRVQQAENLEQFLSALDQLIVPPLNVVYADVEGNIAIHPCGAIPLRTHGQGRIPLDGASGDFDWAGMIPRSELPLAVNPPEHYVASANNRPAGIGYPHYLGWMWDCSYRKRRINDLLEQARDLTADRMRAIQLDAYDKAAERFLPSMLKAVPRQLADPVAQKAREEVGRWDYVSDADAVGPLIWLRWFSIYRQQVWDDEWAPRGIEKVGGSWGFSGTNRREPMLEVLEYLTREFPDAIWFDDRSTPRRETRDDIARRSFDLAVASLKKEFSEDLARWRWAEINTLHVRSLSGQDVLARAGGPVPGTAFTVNPGGDIGRVGGGASYRLIVDFAVPDQSVAVYPGGQSEDPASPSYADQIRVWASGEYLPLAMQRDPAKLAESARKRKLVLTP